MSALRGGQSAGLAARTGNHQSNFVAARLDGTENRLKNPPIWEMWVKNATCREAMYTVGYKAFRLIVNCSSMPIVELAKPYDPRSTGARASTKTRVGAYRP